MGSEVVRARRGRLRTAGPTLNVALRIIGSSESWEGAVEFFDFVFEDTNRVVAVEDAILVIAEVRIEGAFLDLAFGDALLNDLQDLWSGRHRIRDADDMRDVPEGSECRMCGWCF